MVKCILLVAVVLALAGCSKPGTDNNAASEPSGSHESSAVSTLELGRRIYNFRCYYCHGYSGNAKTLAASFIDPKPVDFTRTSPISLDRERMKRSIQFGRQGTAMMGFSSILKPDEITAVTDFIRQEFMVKKAENTRYHTDANGWPNHQRYAAAFPFALGEIPLDTPWEKLTAQQAEGKRLFMSSCMSCHDRARVNQKGVVWESSSISFPRNQFSPGEQSSAAAGKEDSIDAMSSATPYHLHDRVPLIKGLTPSERRGESLFQKNCAFCHAADGTARNWIGSFMEPHPRDLTKSPAMDNMTRARLRSVIRDGLPGTSMPAWKSVLSEQQIEDIISYVGRAFHPLKPE